MTVAETAMVIAVVTTMRQGRDSNGDSNSDSDGCRDSNGNSSSDSDDCRDSNDGSNSDSNG